MISNSNEQSPLGNELMLTHARRFQYFKNIRNIINQAKKQDQSAKIRELAMKFKRAYVLKAHLHTYPQRLIPKNNNFERCGGYRRLERFNDKNSRNQRIHARRNNQVPQAQRQNSQLNLRQQERSGSEIISNNPNANEVELNFLNDSSDIEINVEYNEQNPQPFIIHYDLIHNPKQQFSSSEQIFNKLPTTQYFSSFDNYDNSGDCLICMERIEEGDMITYLVCFHYYHSECCKKWLQMDMKCPLCKIDIKEYIKKIQEGKQ